MAWPNSDDLLLPGALSTVADYFARHPDVDVVYGDRLLIDRNGMEIGRWIMPGHDNTVLSWVDYIPQETLFWRRRIWDKTGAQVDESFRVCHGLGFADPFPGRRCKFFPHPPLPGCIPGS